MAEEGNDLPEEKEEASPPTKDAGNGGVQKGKEKLIKRIANSIKSGAAKQSLLAAIGPILLWAFVIIVILIIIIGIAMFLVTMPGMVMEQLKALFKEAGNFIAAFFGADTTKQIENTEIYSTLDYLEQMGWDLKGEGFLTDYVKSEDEIDKDANKDNGVNLDKKVGVLRDNDDKIITAKSDFIFTYMVSDNYVYTIKNHNLATQKDSDNWLTSFFKGVATAIYKYYNALFGPVFDFLGITEAYADEWGRGLLAFYYDNGVGIKGKYVNTESIWNWDAIEIDTESKKLLITRNEFMNNNNAMEFSLDGWTGRYGMPLEFLLAIHKATMMPDLAYDMATTFNTNVNIYLHHVEGEAITAYKGNDGYITYEDINEKLNGLAGRNIISSAFTWLDSLVLSDEEANIALELGIPASPNCNTEECKKTETITYAGYPAVEVAGSDPKKYTVTMPEGYTFEVNEEQVTKTLNICSECKAYIKKVYKYLRKDNDYNFKAYHPYIANVTNHWYRDVYFVLNKNTGQNKEFVDYDYDYEIMTGERWTLYETDENGDFVYYKLNDDGGTGDKYEGMVVEGEVEYVKGEKSETLRIASIGEDGTKVVKKAVTFSSSDTNKMKDLGWNQNTTNVWSAYEENTSESSTGYEPAYPDIDESEEDYDVKSKIYVDVKTTGNIVQTGEGQRTETNPEIKKMFLLNNYFRYDGTDATAEIITAMREKLYSDKKNYYGAVSDTDAKKELQLSFDDAKYTSKLQNGTYKVSDYVGNVTLNQDSLNAFTMLENTHTLDADYIYRDFKELIVELGYFQKEELTDETPELLQWIVPDIGSGGYPDRSLDKRENEFGTMVHSKSDIEVNKKHTLVALYQRIAQMEEEEQMEGNVPETEPISGISSNNNSQKLSQVNGISNIDSDNVLSSNNQNINLRNVKGTGASFILERVDESGDGYASVLKSGNVTYIHRYQGGQSYSNINFIWAGGSRTLGQAACGLFACFNVLTGYGYDFDPRKDLPGYNWPATMDAVKNLMEEKGVTGEFISYTDTAALDSALNEGRPAILLFQSTVDRQGVRWTSGGHFVALAGKDKDGNILTLDSAAQGNVKRHDYPGTVEDMQPAFQTASIWIADEPPTGMKKDEAEPYEGYEGNEAVVSPVTGILLDYGTYEKNTTQEPQPENPTPDGETPEKVTTEDPRVNVDLKYGFPNIYENNAETGDEGATPDGGTMPGGNNEEFESQIVSDKVGYAKILVLDAENYQKLEGATASQWQTNSLVRIDQTTVELGDTDQVTSNRVSFIEALTGENPNKDEDEDEDEDYSKVYENWSMVDKTIYGYKEFAETYEKYGIAGYVVYIDGFKCELPDDSLSGEEGGEGEEGEEKNMAEQMPQGKALTIDSFKQTEEEIKNEVENEYIQTKYESDEAYKLASEKATNKLAAEVDLKTQAAASISINDNGNDLIFIKEGTVIGRTLTDKELLESPDFRNGKYGTYEELRGEMKESEDSKTGEGEDEDNLKLIGNYLRIILQDEEGTTVENVEDYMKLDEGQSKKTECEFEQLAYYLGCLLEGFYERMDLGDSYGTEVLKDGAGNTTAFGLTKAVADTVSSEWPSFAAHLASGTVPKDEAQDVYILVLEAAKESIQKGLTTPLDENDTSLFALIDLHHASPSECNQVIDIYNSKNNNLSAEEMISVFSEHWGTNENYGTGLRIRGTNRGLLASEGRFFLYQEGSDGDEVIFDTETPWTEFCEAGGTYEMTRESSGIYHVEKDVYTNYSVSY